MTKEEVYDTEVSPLMAKIIAICKRNKIALLANFQLSGKGEDDLRCTTALLEDAHQPSKEQLMALGLLKDGYTAFAITTRKSADKGASNG